MALCWAAAQRDTVEFIQSTQLQWHATEPASLTDTARIMV
jgi:hypothetical protein